MISVVCIFRGLLSLISEVPDLGFLLFFMCMYVFFLRSPTGFFLTDKTVLIKYSFFFFFSPSQQN